MLMSDIDSDEERDKATLDCLLVALMSELNLPLQKDAVIPDMSCRSYMHEMQLVVMRLFSVLMSRTKTGSKPSSEVLQHYCTCSRAQLGGSRLFTTTFLY